MLGAYYNQWRSVAIKNEFVSGVIASIAIQPLPKRIAQIARDKGGDLVDLDPDVDRLILEFDYSYWLETDDATIDQANQELYGGVKTLVDGFAAEGVIADAYRPLFMNDGYFREDYFGRLKNTSRSLAANGQQRIDPHGFTKTRTSGFRI